MLEPLDLSRSIYRHPFVTIPLVTIAYAVCVIIYRLYFHPLAKFPGPKVAAFTYLYEYYYDGIKKGAYTSEIAEMHKKYGPVVRINPIELHCNNPAWIDQIYAAGGKRREKSGFFCAQFNLGGAGFATVSHELHRSRRGAMNRYFSKAAVSKLEPMIQKMAEKLCDKFEHFAETGEPVELAMAYSCLATDVVTGMLAACLIAIWLI
jgi:cytochrome P450